MMVPLQAECWLAQAAQSRKNWLEIRRTKLLLDDLEDLLVIELGRDTLHRSQGLASITLCDTLR
jgi:hypothetical protein